ncbi:MAG: hypothetical protein AAGF93_20810 [Cyanobacteria bacterium P01_H01_bin.105]
MTHRTLSPWTSNQLIRLSKSLASAYGTGLEKNARSNDHGWSTQQLLTASAAKGFPFN